MRGSTVRAQSTPPKPRPSFPPSSTKGPRSRQRARLIPAIYQSAEEIEATRERFAQELAALAAYERPEPTERPVIDIGLTAFYLAYHKADNAAFMKALCNAVRRTYTPPPVAIAGEASGERIH